VRHSDSQETWFRSDKKLFTAVLNVLCDCYVRETQHAKRYRQHAERIHYPEFRQELLNIAAEEQKHAESVGTHIETLGGRIPDSPVLLGNQLLLLALSALFIVAAALLLQREERYI
jgi:hypothetical protein